MEELNIEEMTALTGGGHHRKPSINVENENITIYQSNYAQQSNSANVGNVIV